MKIQAALYQYIREHGINITFIASKAGLKYELLRRPLRCERLMSADEFVKIIQALGIDWTVLCKYKEK